MATQLVAEIVGDASKFNKATAEATQHASTLTSGLQKVGTGMVIGAGIAAFHALSAAVGSAVGFVQGSIKSASDLNETMSKVGVVFGDSAEAVVGWSQTAATALGMSSGQALAAAGDYGNLFVSMGLTGAKATEMSTSMVQLAADLGSFNNASPEQTLAAIRSGLLGESEPLKQFGVNLNEATIKAKAMELGLIETTVSMEDARLAELALQKATMEVADATKKHGLSSMEAQTALAKQAKAQDTLEKLLAGTPNTLTAAQKAQAAYAVILAQTATAQGDFARTSNGLANQQKIAEAKMADLSATIGQKLLPVALALQTAFVDKVIPAFESVFNAVAPIGEAVGYVVEVLLSGDDVAQGFVETMENLGEKIGLGPLFRTLSEAIVDVASVAIPTISAAFDVMTGTVLPAVGGAFDWIRANILPPLQAAFGAFTENILPTLRLAFDTVVGVVRDNWPTITAIVGHVGGAVRTAFEAISNIIQAVSPIIRQVATAVFPAVATAAGVLLSVIKTVFETIGQVWNTAYQVGSAVADGLATAFTTASNIVNSVWSGIGSVIRGALNIIIGAINAVIRGWNSLKLTVPTIDLGPLGTFGGFTIGTPDISQLPYLHAGGIVPGAPGSDVMAILQAGERVIPAAEANSGGGAMPPIHIHIDGRELFYVDSRQSYYRQGARGLLPSG